MSMDFSDLFPQMQGIPQVQTPMTQDVSGGASIGPVPLGIQAGPLGAMQQMQQYQNAQQAFAGNEQAQQLEQANAQNTYENLLKNNPMLDMHRTLAMNQLGVQNSLYQDNPELMKAAATSDVSKTIAANYAAQSQSQQEETVAHFNGAIAADRILRQSGYNDDPKLDTFDYNDTKTWGLVQNALGAGNVTGVANTASRQEAQRVAAEAAAGVQTKDYLQKMGLGDSEYVHQVGADNAAKGLGELTIRNQGVIAGMLAQSQFQLGSKLAMSSPQEQARYSVVQTIQQTQQVTPDLARQWISANEMDAVSGQGATSFNASVKTIETGLWGTSIADLKSESIRLGVPGAANIDVAQGDKAKLQLVPALAIALATENLDKSQARAFKNNFGSYDFVTDDATKKLKDASLEEIMHGVSAPGAPGAAATQAVQRAPVNQGPVAGQPPQPQVPPQVTPTTQPLNRSPVQVGQQTPDITMQTSAYTPGPKAPPGMDVDHIMTWLLTNPANHGMPLPEIQKRAIYAGIIAPRNATPSQPVSQ